MHLTFVPPENAAAEWPGLAPALARVCERPACDLSLDDMRELVEAKHALLLVVVDDDGAPVATGLLQCRNHESGRKTAWLLAAAGGRVVSWLPLLQRVEAVARADGCTSLEFVGRRGWGRLLPDYSAKPCERGVHYSKALTVH